MPEKTNLTVRIEKEVVDKARKLGINLSAITENILEVGSFVKENELITPVMLRDAYRRIFIELVGILQEWGAYIKIGGFSMEEEVTDSDGKASLYSFDYSYFLSPKGTIELYHATFEQQIRTWRLTEDWPVDDLYNSEKIIANLIGNLYTLAENNRNKLKDLEILKNVIKTLKTKKTEGASKEKTVS